MNGSLLGIAVFKQILCVDMKNDERVFILMMFYQSNKVPLKVMLLMASKQILTFYKSRVLFLSESLRDSRDLWLGF